MALVTTPPPSSTPFAPLAGWEGILIVLLLLVAVAVAFLALLAARPTAHERSDWQAWLDARSTGHREAATGRADGPAAPPSTDRARRSDS